MYGKEQKWLQKEPQNAIYVATRIQSCNSAERQVESHSVDKFVVWGVNTHFEQSNLLRSGKCGRCASVVSCSVAIPFIPNAHDKTSSIIPLPVSARDASAHESVKLTAVSRM